MGMQLFLSLTFCERDLAEPKVMENLDQKDTSILRSSKVHSILTEKKFQNHGSAYIGSKKYPPILKTHHID